MVKETLRFEIRREGEITKLWDNQKNVMVMTNGKGEFVSNSDFIKSARGKVLIAGLGIGFILNHVIDKCKSILIIEKEKEIIELYNNLHLEKIKIIEADIFDWLPDEKEKFDCIYFDIWNGLEEHTKEAQMLINKFTPFLRQDGWMGYWVG